MEFIYFLIGWGILGLIVGSWAIVDSNRRLRNS